MFAWLTGTSSHPPVFLAFRSSKTFIIVTVSTAVFTDIFAYGIVVPVLPFALTSRIGVAEDQVQKWVAILLAVYGAALLVAAPFCGWAADRTSSRRVPLMLGLLALGGSTALLCAGDSIATVAAGRALQGVSAAVVWVVGLALLVDTVGPEEVGTVMGYVGLSMSLAILVAPLLGGIVFASAGYYAVFAMAFGLIVLDILLRLAMVEKKVARKWIPDEPGVSTEPSKATGKDDATVMQSPNDIEMRLATEETNKDTADGSRLKKEPSTASVRIPDSAPALLKKWCQRLPPVVTLLASRRVMAAMWACFIQSTLLTSFDSILPLFVKDTFGWNSTGAGLIFLPIVISSFTGPFVGWLADKYGPRWLATAGFIFGCPSLILLRLVEHDGMRQIVLLCALLVLVGISLTLVLTPVMAEVTYAVDAKARRRPAGYFGKNGAYAQAYSLFNMAWAAGAMVGPLLGGLVNQSSGWATTTLILGCVSAFTALPTAMWTGGSILKKRRARRDD